MVGDTPASASCRRRLIVMDSFRIDEIARRLLARVPPAVRSVQQDLESNFRAVLRERLSRLDLVSRDEFEAQTRVLERTRARLEALEARLTELEGGGAAAGGARSGAVSADSKP
jgi:BMFP domain-containing protein YqiC